ncbi:RNA 3'-phosphate cyclase, partial [bacterium]|nr:RNA 3'-phosphate cyclase [bacterium]
MNQLIEIDGAMGEGGGQVLRSALALSLVTRKPFRMINIRSARQKPGLLRQHLTAVRAATQIGQAKITGDQLGSKELLFEPSRICPGEYQFSIGTAGSTTLVLQTILPALCIADSRSVLTLEGGTHNPMAPPFDFIQKAFLPIISRMGSQCEANLEKYGFYPAGGGRFVVHINPTSQLRSMDLIERGNMLSRCARAIVASLPRHIAERELEVIHKKTSWPEDSSYVEEVKDSS